MKKSLYTAITASTLFLCSANAGVILDAQVGAGAWMTKTSGSTNYEGGNINLENDLGINDSSNTYFYADFNHFIPLVPNIRIERQELKTNESKSTNVTFGGTNFSSANTNTDLDLTQNDLILYWGIPGINIATLGMLNIDIGIDIKQYEGSIELSNTSSREKADLDFIVPMGYLAAQFKAPFIPATISASTKMSSYEGSELSDSMIMASIDLPIPLPLIDFRLDVGYKIQKYDLSEDLTDNISTDITNKGMILGLSAKF